MYSGSMKTTIDIPDQVLADALRFTKAKTKKDAVLTALGDFNRRQRMEHLLNYSGKFGTMMSNEEIEALEEQEAVHF